MARASVVRGEEVGQAMDLYEARSAMRAALSLKAPDPRAAVDAFRSLEAEARQIGVLRVFYGPLFQFMLPDPADLGAQVLDVDERLREDVLDGLALTWVQAPAARVGANRVRLTDAGASPGALVTAMQAIPTSSGDHIGALHSVFATRKEMSVRLGAVRALQRLGDGGITDELVEMLACARAHPITFEVENVVSAMVAALGLASLRLRGDPTVTAAIADTYDWYWAEKYPVSQTFNAWVDVTLPALTYPQSRIFLDDCLALAAVLAGVRSYLPRALTALATPDVFHKKQRRAPLLALLWRLEPTAVPDALAEVARGSVPLAAHGTRWDRVIVADHLAEALAVVGTLALGVMGILMQDPDPKVRAQTVKALASISDPAATGLIESAAGDTDRKVAKTAARALKRR